MQHVSSFLGRAYKGLDKIVKLRSLWPEVAGELLASHSEPVQLKGKTLWVLCDSPAWVQQVNILSMDLVPRILSLAGIKIDKISPRFSPGRMVSRPRKERKPLARPDIDPRDVERIADPGLREAVRALIEE